MQSPFIFVIFGATGDLAHHKLLPALFELFKQKQLPQDFYIIGFARREMSDQDFSETFIEVNADPAWDAFSKHLFYQQGTFSEKLGYEALIKRLTAIDTLHNACITRIFYLATPPIHYEGILENLHETKLSQGCEQGSGQWTRIAIEKPFGKDVATAKMLDEKLARTFDEKQIFRVDHYLGKETVQNLLVFRFANSMFDPVWNNEYIDHVQITFSETKDVSSRGDFFDGVGILRDVAQNHLMQLVAAVAMEMPASFSKEAVRDQRAKAIEAIVCLSPQEVKKSTVRAQYVGYTGEKKVQPTSMTETYTAIKFFVNTKRFEGVPFYLRAGKALQKEEVKISIVFKQTCHLLFREVGCPEEGNVLTIRIQPDEGISFKVIAKKPGTKIGLESVNMHFSYNEQFGTQGADAYEKLLLDILAGDQMLFNRSDELRSSWEFITSILEGWEQETEKLPIYSKGSTGPKEADIFMEREGKKWL